MMPLLGSLGDLVVSVRGDSAHLRSDLGQAQHVAARFGQDMTRIFRQVGMVLGALGGVGAAGIAGLVKGALDSADAFSKLSQRVGVSVEKLSEWSVAAKLSDVSQQQLQVGLQQLSKNQADFAMGIGEAKEAFAALGITQKEVNELNGDTQKLFERVAGELSKFEDGANKTAIAMKIFGRSGAELLPFINSMQEASNEARELGAVVGSETAKAAERFNDNLTRVGVSVQGVGLRIAEVLLPQLEKMSASMAEAAKHGEAVNVIADLVSNTLKALASSVVAVSTAFDVMGGNIGAFFAAVRQALSGSPLQAFETLKERWRDAVSEVTDGMERISGIWDDTGRRIEASAETNSNKIAAPAMKAAEKVKKAAAEIRDELQRIKDQAAEELDAITQKREDRETMMRQVYETIDAQREAEEERERIAAGVYDQTKDQIDLVKDLGLVWTSAFEDAIVGGKKFSDVLKGLAQDLARLVLRKAVLEPLGNAIGSALGGIFGGARAEGGPVSAGSAYLVGERGPELFVPNTSGAVMSNGAIGGDTYYIDARGADTGQLQRLEATIRAMNGSIERRAVMAIAGARRRGLMPVA